MVDKIKLSLAIVILGIAVAGFYVYEDQSLLLRWVALLVALGISTAIVLQAEVGRTAWSFMRDSTIEIRKVVWPTRKETSQATVMVFAMVVFLGVFLWLLDMFLAWVVRLLTGQGG
jgi:preprotein translocase subunit SecE